MSDGSTSVEKTTASGEGLVSTQAGRETTFTITAKTHSFQMHQVCSVLHLELQKHGLCTTLEQCTLSELSTSITMPALFVV